VTQEIINTSTGTNITKEPFVSIVTPFYNSADTLSECIESVIHQSYSNWEYILVNNCSTDGSQEIAQSYAEQDARIRLVNNSSFLGQVDNYNHALSCISSKSSYCKMVEADNWIFPHCLTDMVTVGENHPSVGIVGSYYLYGDKVFGDGLKYPSTRIRGVLACITHMTRSIPLFGAPTNLLMLSEIVRQRTPFYPTNSLHEDTEVCYIILQDWDFGFVHQVLSYLRVDEGSISSGLSGVDSYNLTKLVIFKRYGKWLFPDIVEYNRQRQRIESKYYNDLIELLISRRRSEVWQLHKKALDQCGYQISWPLLIRGTVWTLGDILFNMKKTIGRIMR
jgi:glycosyltransferase involved in cell wall biosynthesis